MVALRAIVACYEAPGWGGVSTVAHDLVRHLHDHQRDHDITLLTLVDDADEPYYRLVFGRDFANPHGLRNAVCCALTEPLPGEQPALVDAIARTNPDVIVAIGGVAGSLLARAAHSCPLVFLAAGCEQAKQMIVAGRARDVGDLQLRLRRMQGWPPLLSATDEKAVIGADLILSNGALVSSLLAAFYPSHTGKIYPEPMELAPWIHHATEEHRSLARPFDDRDIDLVFVASAWDRPEKNYATVVDLIRMFPRRTIHVVGEADRRVENATYHGLLSNRRDVFALLGRAKTLVCPSLFDSAPGVLIEGSALGCNLVATPNCGNVEICHEDLIAPRATARAMSAAIERSLSKRFPDRYRPVPAEEASARLMRILAALCRVPIEAPVIHA